jgi:hypothetical protein
LAFETTSTRVWKHLTREERLLAAQAFWQEPPAEAAGAAIGAIVKLRKLRPQVARSLPLEQRAAALAAVLDPGESVAAALLVALHLEARRPLLAAFLDALGLPHVDGVLKDDAAAEVSPEAPALQAAVERLRAAFPAHEVATYLNTLWLQDPERWKGLESALMNGPG